MVILCLRYSDIWKAWREKGEKKAIWRQTGFVETALEGGNIFWYARRECMGKRILGIGALFLASMLALAGCGGGGGAAQLPAPSNVKAALTGDTKNVIVTWDAVEVVGADYQVVSQKQGKKTIWEERGGSNYATYAAADGEESKNTDPDKWAASISSGGIGESNFLKPGDKVRFGVITVQALGTTGSYSPVAWSGYITVQAEAAQ
jgi:hypothetical protein